MQHMRDLHKFFKTYYCFFQMRISLERNISSFSNREKMYTYMQVPIQLQVHIMFLCTLGMDSTVQKFSFVQLRAQNRSVTDETPTSTLYQSVDSIRTIYIVQSRFTMWSTVLWSNCIYSFFRKLHTVSYNEAYSQCIAAYFEEIKMTDCDNDNK